MLTVSKLAVVGWDSAITKWPIDDCTTLFEKCGVKRLDGTLNDAGNDWDKATFPFDVTQPGMVIVGKKTDGTPKLGVDASYTEEQAGIDAKAMFKALGRDKYVRHSCNGFDLGARKDAPPTTTLKSGKVSDDAKAIWCLFSSELPKKDTANKSVQQLVALYDEKHPS